MISFLIFAVLAQASVPAKTPDNAKVIVEEVKSTEDFKRLLVPVKVEARMRSVVTAEIEGWVTKIKKPLGSTVKRGEVVLLIENKDPTFTFAAVPVRSPVAGVVSQMDPSLMSKVARGERLFAVIDPSALKLSAEIPGSDLPALKPGALGTFKGDLSAKEGLPIKLTGVSPLMDPRTGTAPAELEFMKGKEALPAIGSVGHVLFEIPQGQVLLVPENSISYFDGKPVVKILGRAGKVEKKAVELGEQKEANLVVKAGLSSGEKLIVRSSRPVKEGEVVDVESMGKN